VAENPDRNPAPEFNSDNPSVNPETHTVNPSAPTIGTEAWGKTTDERRTLSGTEPTAREPGQVKANRGSDPGSDRAELSRRMGATATSMNISHEGHDRTYRCADTGNADCRWETSGTSDEEIMEQAREHARSQHGWNDWTEALRTRVRDAIRERRAP